VAGQPGSLALVDGPMGSSELGVRSIAVSLDGGTVAGVTEDGGRVLVTSVRGTEPEVEEVVSGAGDLLPPAWDFDDRLWLADRTDGRTVFSYLTGEEPRTLRVPGLTGRTVSTFLVSRDGSRLVAVVRGRQGDELLVSRLRRNDQGGVVGASPAHRIGWEGETGLRIRDIAWSSPTSIAVLHRVAKQLFELRTISVDGAPSGVEDLLTQLTGPVVALAGSPAPGESLYAVTRTSLDDQTRGDAVDVPLDPAVTFVDYVG
jgi:hypothetical protein